jgi:hypothetical protein
MYFKKEFNKDFAQKFHDVSHQVHNFCVPRYLYHFGYFTRIHVVFLLIPETLDFKEK